jgi:competence protein ComEC
MSQASTERISWRTRVWRAFLSMARTQAWVTLALTPLSLVCFQQASLVSLLANLVAIPVFTVLITPLALAGTVWSPCWDLAAWVWRGMMPALSTLADWPLATWSMPVLPVWSQVLLVGAGVVQVLPIPWRWRMSVWPVLVAVVYLPHGLRELSVPPQGQFQLLAADVGQGTAVFIRTASHTLLFDTGPRLGQQLNAGDRTLLPMMRAMGLSRLDALMLSHQDSDHVGGAEAIMRQSTVMELHSSLPADHPLLQQHGATGSSVPHRSCLAGQHWGWDGVDFEVLHPTPSEYARRDEVGTGMETNAMSCVLKVTSRSGRGALLTGDIGQQQEGDMLARAQVDPGLARSLQSTVLMAPHHGSRFSSSEAFLQAVSPQAVVIQAGVRNRYGHPAADVLARYQGLGLSWVDSPHCGAYIWRSDEPPSRRAPASSTPAIGWCWRALHRHYWQDALQ